MPMKTFPCTKFIRAIPLLASVPVQAQDDKDQTLLGDARIVGGFGAKEGVKDENAGQ